MKFSNVEYVVNSSSDSPTFKTHDTIDGEIVFTHQETNIEDITITFKGMMRVEVENMNTRLALPFLSMDMPIYDYFGDTNTLKPGKRYRLPLQVYYPRGTSHPRLSSPMRQSPRNPTRTSAATWKSQLPFHEIPQNTRHVTRNGGSGLQYQLCTVAARWQGGKVKNSGSNTSRANPPNAKRTSPNICPRKE
ncbi:hypothetical protein PENFLA_c006G05006 [Penicillium flavigenum]|uniref:Arrestin-like N-terminal domain-containing protein n=1 Tax=Penicillium flavigenum TaxID=254877 RepID=A0A1V6TMT1_9EURO|nr:hypothetical protein PENFLA_c006G05006 [Penicillium flavigenum]